MEQTDAVVLGAGVVGLAIARTLCLSGLEVVVFESRRTFGSETSSRNSGVIHAGIYYPGRSLKGILCRSGQMHLYTYCDTHQIPYSRLGKLIVATTPEQLQVLERIEQMALVNGVDDLKRMSAKMITQLEPEVNAVEGIFSPSTGILDVHDYLSSLAYEVESNGGVLAFRTYADRFEVSSTGLEVFFDGDQRMRLKTRFLVNSTGLASTQVLRNSESFPSEHIPVTYLAKGNYFSLQGKAPFSHLIYPVPEAGGLGIHATLDLAGQVRFGPDVEWVNDINYQVDESRKNDFYKAIKNYYPNIDRSRLMADYAGIRPKLQGPNDDFRDFLIQDVHTHGIDGLINLFGIESPGLTASLAIAEMVSALCEV
ncbi:NAD(P)/FAD-dependent oxidoreductase [Sedimenticola selenatireducens]|uniref:FAD-dependent oxidoreductase n=1 Tax=Sedimenticola selenatireducens TaxID=191960 RepID=A0A2N6CWF1_9GAMM|nr:NAD(P)/FAD-dependent oxidoreductase [Sedimenticola selenatireducens]PLX61586.1 MAG: FAD-dependent oxidoreductase [Sedimenticola selenatireducens]